MLFYKNEVNLSNVKGLYIMNNIDFFNEFSFNVYKFDKYHFTDNSKTPLPYHYFVSLIQGSGKIRYKNKEILLSPGEILYFPKGLKYQSHWFGNENDEVAFYSFGFKKIPVLDSFVLQKINCTQKAKDVFNELCEEVPITPKAVGKLYYFFGEVSDNMIKSERSFTNHTVEKAVEVITENPDIKISELAKLCSVSESGIYILFKKFLKKTPNEVRLEIICDKAVSLLTTTNETVQTISDILGFSSTSYFRKILKKYTNKTPLEIRKDAIF